MAVYVLVPGGFAGSWQWREVRKSLWEAGHEVYTPSLTGMGERVHLAHPEINLSTFVQDVVLEITCSDLSAVILVGYSFGGMVITGVAEQISERIAQLVYLDAYVPKDGQSVADLVGPAAAEMAVQAAKEYGEGWKLFPGEPDPDPRLTPLPIKSALEKLILNNPQAKRIPRTFIACLDNPEDDLNLLPVIKAAAEIKNDPSWQYFEIESDHLVVRDHPDLVSEILLELAVVKA